MELCELDGAATARLVAKGEASVSEVVESHLRRIDETNPRLNAIVRRTDDDARSTATRLDALKSRGELAGVVALREVPTVRRDLRLRRAGAAPAPV